MSNVDAQVAALNRLASGRSPQAAASEDGPLQMRRWDAAATNRLNKAHWQKASGSPINADLSLDWETLVTRCTHEAANGGILEGVIETHVADVVGPRGPTVDVDSPDKQFNTWAEAHWNNWWSPPADEAGVQGPDIEGRLSGRDKLALWIRMGWKAGEFLERIVVDPQAGGLSPVTLRLKSLHPRRLATPFGSLQDARVVLGVEKTEHGRPVAYHVQLSPDREGFVSFFGHTTRVPAKDMIHDFLTVEPDQARGVPWAATALQVIADIRDADDQILDGLRAAADYSVALYTDNPDVDFVPLNESAEIERRMISTMPPGYKPMALEPGQPTTNYLDFRDERLREIGRGRGMPLEKIKASNKGLNFSQSKHGQGNYWRHVEALQVWLQGRVLDRLFKLVIREAMLAELAGGGNPPIAPRNAKVVWNWPPPPKVDKRIEAMGDALNRSIAAATLEEITGQPIEELVGKHKREREVFAEAGVPYPEIEQVLEAAKVGAAVAGTAGGSGGGGAEGSDEDV